MSIKYIIITSLLALAVCVLSGVYHGVEITVEFIVYCYGLVLFIIALVFSGRKTNKNKGIIMSKPPFTMSKYVHERDARKYYQERCEQLKEVAIAMREWIDAVPSDVELPAMPGFDRDWADEIIDTE